MARVKSLSSQYRRSIEFNRPKGATILILMILGMSCVGVEISPVPSRLSFDSYFDKKRKAETLNERKK